MWSFLRHLRAAFRRPDLDRELREEMAQHLEWKTQAYVESGLPAAEAHRRAAVDVGNVTRLREDARATWGFPSLDSIVQDLQYGLRLLRRSPVFSAVAVLSLAIGIGAGAAVFSLADSVLLEKLPVSDPDGLLVLRWVSGPIYPFESLDGYGDDRGNGHMSTSFSRTAFLEMQKAAAPLADILGFADLYRVTIAVAGEAEIADAHVVSGNYFSVLGVRPLLGRPLVAADDVAGAPAAAVITESLWRRRFGASPDAIGRAVIVNGLPFTVVGVVPAPFVGTGQVGAPADVFLPLASYPALLRLGPQARDDATGSNFWWVLMMARPHAGVSPAALNPVADGVLKRTVAAAKPTLTAKDLPQIELLPGARGQVEERGEMLQPLRMMAGVVGIVLLVACANVAHLLLARGRARMRELSVRVAIGAPRKRVVRQLLTEGVLLAACGSALGMLFAEWIAAALLPALSGPLPLDLSIGLNLRVLGFVVALAGASAILFGLVPALRASDVPLASGLQEAGRGTGAGGGSRLSGALVVAQIALSMMLVTSAALMVRSVRNLQQASLGFDPHGILTFKLDPTLNGYPDARVRQLYASLLDTLRTTPGVIDATLTRYTLISNASSTGAAVATGEAAPAPDSKDARPFVAAHLAMRLAVDERFFSTFGIPLLRGRLLSDEDREGEPRVAVVNRALALQLFHTEDVVGRTFRLGLQANAPQVTIVGVVVDARYASVRRPMAPTAYLSYRQEPPAGATIEIKTAGDPSAFAGTARAIVQQLDSTLPIATMRSQDEQIAESLRQEHLFARLATLLGAVTLALAAIGLYALLAYAVTRRTPEIGLRMALGAESSTIGWMILRQSVRLSAGGLLLGIAGAAAGGRLLQSLLYNLPARDPATFALAAAVMLLTVAGAAYLPARRATHVDPLVALRAE